VAATKSSCTWRRFARSWRRDPGAALRDLEDLDALMEPSGRDCLSEEVDVLRPARIYMYRAWPDWVLPRKLR